MSNFSKFDQRAGTGERLNVVFIGGSLTWGSNTTDPQLFSYRALVMKRLQDRYPRTPLHFRDASIGGHGSQLAAFRLDRDVLKLSPDLFFLEYAVNDGFEVENDESLCAFEAVLRRILSEANCPTVVTLLPLYDQVAQDRPVPARHMAHRRIAEAYGCPVAAPGPVMRELVRTGRVSLSDLWANPDWPVTNDYCHPGDAGHALYADVIWRTCEEAFRNGTECRIPEKMLYRDTYLNPVRFPLVSLDPMPKGWRARCPNRQGAAYDFMMSRWLDRVLVISQEEKVQIPEPLMLQFQGTAAFLFGEATTISGKYRVTIDGRPSTTQDDLEEPGVFNAGTRLPGNMPHFRVLAEGLSENQIHTLLIEPMLNPGQELRLESICLAGRARVIKTAGS